MLSLFLIFILFSIKFFEQLLWFRLKQLLGNKSDRDTKLDLICQLALTHNVFLSDRPKPKSPWTEIDAETETENIDQYCF